MGHADIEVLKILDDVQTIWIWYKCNKVKVHFLDGLKYYLKYLLEMRTYYGN